MYVVACMFVRTYVHLRRNPSNDVLMPAPAVLVRDLMGENCSRDQVGTRSLYRKQGVKNLDIHIYIYVYVYLFLFV